MDRTKNPDIEAGYKFASAAIESLCETGTGEDPLLFYASMIGTHLGNIAAHIGKAATLRMIDCLREQVAAALPDKGKIQ